MKMTKKTIGSSTHTRQSQGAQLGVMVAALAGLGLASSVYGASGLFKSASSANFNDVNNWYLTDNSALLGSVPGAIGTTNSADTVTCNGNSTTTKGLIITVDDNRNIKGFTYSSGGPGFTWTGGSFIFTNGGSFAISGGTRTHTINTPMTLAGGFSFSPASTTVININGTITGSTTDGVGAQVLTLQGSATVFSTISSVISNGSGVGNSTAVQKSGSNLWALTAANTYSGGTILSAGTLAAGDDSAFGSGNFTFNGTSTIQSNDGTAHSFSNALGTFAGSSAVYTFGATSGGTGNLTFSNSAAASLGTVARTFAVNNTTQLNAALSGTGASIVKTQGGTLILAGANSFTGGTTISAGILKADNNTALGTGTATINGGTLEIVSGRTITNPITLTSGTLTVNGTIQTGALTITAGTIKGSGTINQAITVGSGLLLSPGNSPGQMNGTSQTWAAGGSYQWEINSASGTAGVNWDLVNLSNSLSITSTSASPFTMNITSLDATNASGAVPDFNPLVKYQWLMADTANPIAYNSATDAGNFVLNHTAFDTLNGSGSGTWSLERGDSAIVTGGDNTQLYLVYSVPEPAAFTLVGISVMGLLTARRRRTA